MPELPEVETIRLQLSAVLPGQKIHDVSVKRAKMFVGKPQILVGKQIRKIRRYSKLLVIDLSEDLSLVVHLRMTGRLVYRMIVDRESVIDGEINYQNDRHTHITIRFENENILYFHDQRTFGYLQLVPTASVESLPYVKTLGPEFFRNLSEEQFIEILKSSKRPVKTVLLDQQKLGGVGNIYANEGLWMAKVHPEMAANRLSTSQAKRLFRSLSEVMTMAIKYGGTSSDNYRDANGSKGKALNKLSVYERTGKQCLRCGTAITKYITGGRGTYVCPKCQKK